MVQITYDALEYGGIVDNSTDHVETYSAIWPERTGIIVFNVGDSNSAKVETGIGLTEFDTIYYARTINGEKKDSYAKYTFYPEDGDGRTISVRVQKPLQSDWQSGWETYQKDENGFYTVKLYDGPNIIEVKAGNSTQYHVVYANGLDIKIENKEDPGRETWKDGDTAVISFEGLITPLPKLGAVYNPGYPSEGSSLPNNYVEYEMNGNKVEGTRSQYQINLTNALEVELNETGTVRLENGRVHTSVIGDTPPSHQMMTKESKLSSYTGADSPEKNDYYCILRKR